MADGTPRLIQRTDRRPRLQVFASSRRLLQAGRHRWSSAVGARRIANETEHRGMVHAPTCLVRTSMSASRDGPPTRSSLFPRVCPETMYAAPWAGLEDVGRRADHGSRTILCFRFLVLGWVTATIGQAGRLAGIRPPADSRPDGEGVGPRRHN